MLSTLGHVDARVAIVAADVVGAETMATLRYVAEHSAVRVVLVSNEIPRADLAEIASCGVVTVFGRCTTTTADRLFRAVRTASKAEPLRPTSSLKRLREQLDHREKRQLELVAEGWEDDEIATETGYTITTVERYRWRVKSRLGLRGRAHAAGYAALVGLV
ncbi:DNA-binding NarL/FixJ family response regulator [Kutzneria buriramensis]|uniref:DNA-binding NarL/FixJ family response regulator n=1 Tax=Kutzneria buriramensis TaxID=1045776 RepID=A0A3E0HJA9_9PSEU|nr:DNA-binding NarL/FixJ family response regulator [Kutzneria buriramensis]